MSVLEAGPLLRFGTFELDPRNGELRKAGALVKLPRQPFQVLCLLAANPGQLLTREQIQREIWGDGTFVDFDRNLNVCITQIRAALHDDSESPRFIQTVPRRGYRFVAPVERLGETSPEPASKPQSSAAPALRRRILGAAGIVVLLGLTGFLLRHRAVAPGQRILIAALPFDNLSGGQADEPLIDGLTEELITQLGGIHPARLGVIARSSVMRYKRSPKSIDQIGRDLGVNYVIEGSVRRDGDHLRVNARLIKVADQAQVWTETFDSDISGTAEVERDDAARISAALTAALFPGSGVRTSPAHTPSPSAWASYRDGRYLEHNSGDRTLQSGIVRFQDAVKADPQFAEAYAAAADAYVRLSRSGDHPEVNFPQAKTAATSALALDESLAEAHNALANALFWYDWKWQDAETQFRRAIEINPSYSLAHHDYAWLMLARGRIGDAVNSIHLAMALDPLSPRINVDSGWLLLYAHRYGETIEQNRRTLQLEPSLQEVHACLARAYVYQNNYAAAKAEMLTTIASPELKAELETLEPEASIKRWYRVRLEKSGPAGNAYLRAQLQAFLGEKQNALEALDRAYREHSVMLPLLWADPSFTDLHNDARFKEIAKRAGLI